MTRRKLVWTVVTGCLMLSVGYQVFAAVSGVLRDHRLSRQATAWREQALQETGPSATVGDAERWLREHGFRFWSGEGTRSAPGVEERLLFVWGRRQLEEGAWLEVNFDFDLGGKFKGIDTCVHPIPLLPD